eukprot:6394531-Amphidinium_carterae.1
MSLPSAAGGSAWRRVAPGWSSGTARERGCQMMRMCKIGLASSRVARSRRTSSSSRDETHLMWVCVPSIEE